ncbi:Pyridoxal-phosphate-dependent serine hydroxymethyltransferase [Dermatophilus congolensis]|uniref:Serine hydroxymethyltransferase n=1 Tax=Dermatophilus congolensis TaxID=1863 RepID=A0A239VFJ4_9MICO|nr:glycine hydroxymethyltransferase [Dermatophilus congolensis]SNV20453.1 Pyridoxal-phosphate-dependent serine hydroxymethyltransferase [Dermatophilus congolensis]
MSDTDLTAQSTAFRNAISVIEGVEPRIAQAIRSELRDQRSSLKLIASENYASTASLLALGNWLSDKYAEGTIGHRFYAGCQNIDTVESVAAEHARELFGAQHAYVQPHSGIDANLVAYWAILAHRVQSPALDKAGVKSVYDLNDAQWASLRAELGNQRLMGLALDAGGHLTHGYRPNISGKMFDQHCYSTDPQTGVLDYAQVAQQVKEFKPLILVAGYSAYPRLINMAKMKEIADSVGAVLMVDMAHFAGLVAGKVATGEYDPVAYADVVTTTTHKSLRGPRGGLVLCTDEFKDAVDKGCPMVLGGPLSNMMAGKAVALAEARKPEFQTYARNIVDNAVALAEGLKKRGAKLVSDGTENHIVLLDVGSYGITGRQAEGALLESGIVTNRNSIPNDPNGAWFTTGIRFGTPALTSRGLGVAEMDTIAEMVDTALKATKPGTTSKGAPSKAQYVMQESVAARVHAQADELLAPFPLYPEVDLG